MKPDELDHWLRERLLIAAESCGGEVTTILWIIATILVIVGIVCVVRGAVFYGVVLIIFALIGPGGGVWFVC